MSCGYKKNNREKVKKGKAKEEERFITLCRNECEEERTIEPLSLSPVGRTGNITMIIAGTQRRKRKGKRKRKKKHIYYNVLREERNK